MTDEAALAFVQQYCLDCHRGADAEAELDLSRFDLTDGIAADYTIWNEIARRVDEGEIPPEDGETAFGGGDRGRSRSRFIAAENGVFPRCGRAFVTIS